MAAVPARYRPAISEWRRTTYLSQVWARRAQKYRQQLEVWDANAEAAAEGKDIEAGPEDNMVWWTNASKQELLRLQREADGKVDQLFPLARSLKARGAAARDAAVVVLMGQTAPAVLDDACVGPSSRTRRRRRPRRGASRCGCPPRARCRRTAPCGAPTT